MPYKNKADQLKCAREWHKKHPRKKEMRDYALRTKYGITQEEYDRLFQLQNGKCAGCGKTLDSNLCVDHDHGTGKVRGLLCKGCNLAIGNVKDNPETFLKLYQYLLLWPNEQGEGPRPPRSGFDSQ